MASSSQITNQEDELPWKSIMDKGDKPGILGGVDLTWISTPFSVTTPPEAILQPILYVCRLETLSGNEIS